MNGKSSYLSAATLALLLSAGTASASDIVVHAGRLIDGVDKAPKANVSIVIHDDRIVGVEPGHRLAQRAPQRFGQRIELVRPVERQRYDTAPFAIALDQKLLAHARPR